MKRNWIPIGTLAAITCGAMGAPIVDLTVDPVQSSIDLDITVDVSIASDTDTDSSPLSGSLRVELDDYTNPSQITLHDLFVNIDETLNFNWSFSFFGSADADLVGGAVTWGSTDAPVGPVPIDEGAFVLPDVPTALQGQLDVFYDILLVGTGSESINLADQGDFFSSIDGSISVEDGVITVSSTLPIDVVTPLTDADGNTLGTLIASGSATIVATGDAPVCVADLTGDGTLDFFDISAFLNAFTTMNPLADFDNNGVFDFFDVSLFLNAFSAWLPLIIDHPE